MSDDIDRLKLLLEDFNILKDGIVEGHEAMRDIVAAVTPVELETDPEGHGALRDVVVNIRTAFAETRNALDDVETEIVALAEKARA